MAAFALFSSDARAEKRVALVIGNGGYQNASKLTNPPNDAAAIAAMFRDAGFEVVEAKTDLGNLEFKRVAREFTAVARDSDIAVLFYAGHGIEVNGTNYLIPVDAKLATDFDVEDEALSLDRLVRALEPAKRLRLIILDACRDNPFTRNMQRTIATPRGRERPCQGRTRDQRHADRLCDQARLHRRRWHRREQPVHCGAAQEPDSAGTRRAYCARLHAR